MPYAKKDFTRLFGTPGFSDRLLKDHFTLYEGYVKSTNSLAQTLGSRSETPPSPEYSELKRRFGWEFNGMRLHEYYFGNLKNGGAALPSESELGRKLAEDFGSVAGWERDFRAAGAMRGIGWVVLYFDAPGRRLLNAWIEQHDQGHLAGLAPVLVLDAFEHAYFADYGLDRASYLNAFFKAIDWEESQERYHAAAFQEARPH
ncbi:MAG TPA: Fe-Mn family superoxide dismutase [Candidatus Eisenbacteria bacterium]|nr:Fe-Mn family superoxide dismutase [Candidatus Eisenbacteria bacterium]